MLKMFLISCFSARNPDTLCVPACLKGEICNEIVGKCICDPTLRDVEWCKARRREYEKFLSGNNIISKSPLHLRWLPPVLHFPEPLNFTKGFLAHYDGLVPVLARWCYNSFQLLNSCTPNINFVTMATIQRPKYTLYLPFDCILHKN